MKKINLNSLKEDKEASTLVGMKNCLSFRASSRKLCTRKKDSFKVRDHTYYIYILSNPRRTVLYIGFTQYLTRRLDQHIRNKYFNNKKSFPSRYNCGDIIYYEVYQYVREAIAREKQLKKWRRSKKETLINSQNPNWATLNENFKN